MGIRQSRIGSVLCIFYERIRGKISSFFSWLNNYLKSRRNRAPPVLPVTTSNVDPSLLTIIWEQYTRFESLSSSSSGDGDEKEKEKEMIINGMRAKMSDELFEHENFLRSEQSIRSEFESSSGGEEEEDEEEKKVIIKSAMIENEGIIVRWIKHYNSQQRILVVGDGDFSFSASLAMAFYRASNMIATSLDSQDFLKMNYSNAQSNIEKLRSTQCKVMHGIDATKMVIHESLRNLRFDRIIFNFPFAGFFKELPRESQLKRHRRLVSLFLKNAKEMISEDGEIHISHKTNGFHRDWIIECVASTYRLRLIEAVKFCQRDYPGYNTKCGFGTNNNFNCNPSKTYKFGLRTV